ncbi:hypothetical protein PJL18_02729 [Paenarthrobacter nicotinovorans]|nr:hypothetical protein [Paenarthrobacter nicotinovorans]
MVDGEPGGADRVADIHDRLVIHQVQFLDGGRVDGTVEDFLQPDVKFGFVVDGPVQHHRLVAVGGQDLRVVTDEHHQQDQRHEGQRQPQGLDADARDQAQRQCREVVSDLVLGKFGGAEPDDREHTEQPQAQTDAGSRTGQCGGDCEDSHVHAEVGHHQVTAPVAAEVQGQREDGNGSEVCRYEDEGVHRLLRNLWGN